nr:hypothetical protein [Pseudonocardia nigra]
MLTAAAAERTVPLFVLDDAIVGSAYNRRTERGSWPSRYAPCTPRSAASPGPWWFGGAIGVSARPEVREVGTPSGRPPPVRDRRPELRPPRRPPLGSRRRVAVRPSALQQDMAPSSPTRHRTGSSR